MFGGAPKCARSQRQQLPSLAVLFAAALLTLLSLLCLALFSCSKSVYAAEEVVAGGRKYHPSCFTCAECSSRLSSGSLCEKNDKIYCEACYARLYGPKGFGIGGPSVHTGISVADNKDQGAICASCGAKDQSKKFCGECGKPTAGATNNQTAAYTVAALTASTASNASSSATTSSASSSSSSASSLKPSVPSLSPNIGSKFGGGNKCATCNKTVYAAESVIAAGKEYHESCFVCTTCHHRLSSTTLAERDANLYCQTCYNKQFGPKGFGFGGGGAGVLTHTGIDVASKAQETKTQ